MHGCFFKPFTIQNLKIDLFEVEHQKKTLDRKPPCFGYIFEENGKKVAYASDFNQILEKEKLQNCDLLIADGSTMEPKYGHIGIKEGVKLYKELNPKQLLFTHVSHFAGTHNSLEEYVRQFGNIGIAYDGLEIEI